VTTVPIRIAYHITKIVTSFSPRIITRIVYIPIGWNIVVIAAIVLNSITVSGPMNVFLGNVSIVVNISLNVFLPQKVCTVMIAGIFKIVFYN